MRNILAYTTKLQNSNYNHIVLTQESVVRKQKTSLGYEQNEIMPINIKKIKLILSLY